MPSDESFVHGDDIVVLGDRNEMIKEKCVVGMLQVIGDNVVVVKEEETSLYTVCLFIMLMMVC